MTTRKMTVTRAPGTDSKPMVRIANQLLNTMGFTIGAPVEVTYREGVITITKLKHEHEHYVQKPRRPVSHSAAQASRAEDAGASDGHTERKSPDATGGAQTLRQSLASRYVLRGYWRAGNSQNAGPHRYQVCLERSER